MHPMRLYQHKNLSVEQAGCRVLQENWLLANQALNRYRWKKSWADLRLVLSYTKEGPFDDEINRAIADGWLTTKSLTDKYPNSDDLFDYLTTHGFTPEFAILVSSSRN
jgi:hypothetical protein